MLGYIPNGLFTNLMKFLILGIGGFLIEHLLY